MKKVTKLSQLKYGVRVRGILTDLYGEYPFSIGKIAVENKAYSICQDVKRGNTCYSRQGFDYSWYIGSAGDALSNCKELYILEDLDTLEVGDILVDKTGYSRKVLAVIGELVALSQIGATRRDNFYSWCTIQDLRDCGYEIQQEECEEEIETIEINNKKYKLKDVTERIKKLESLD